MERQAEAACRAVQSVLEAGRGGVSDRELLLCCAEGGDQEAFAALVRRHAGMVLGVCRRALPSAQDAEDACQATFLLLWCKARRQDWQLSVANWLHATARRVARNARVSAQRRARREGSALVQPTPQPVDHMTGRELLGALEEELDRLPSRYREPLVLCYLEGLTRDEAARRLGVPLATLKSQLERGRKRLAEALGKRGCVLGSGLLALAVTSPVGASPPRLVEAILASVTGSPPAAVVALAQGVTVNTLVNRWLCVLLAATAVAWLGIGAWAARPDARPAPDKVLPAKAERSSPKPEEKDRAESRTLTGRVVDPAGKAVSGASLVLASVNQDEKLTATELARTNVDGRFQCMVPPLKGRRWEYRLLVACAEGFAADWVELQNASAARPFVFRLGKATIPVRGRVLTLEGKPVAGAIVRLSHVLAPDGKNELKQMYQRWAASPQEAAYLLQKRLWHPAAGGLPEKATTDAGGRFTIRGVGDGRVVAVNLSADTIETAIAWVAVDPAFDPKVVLLDSKKANPFSPYQSISPRLYGPTFDHAAGPCRVIRGRVFDKETKKPLSHVAITGRVPSAWYEAAVYTRTDSAGRYQLTGLPNARCELTFGMVKGDRYLMLRKTVGPTKGLTPAALDMPMVKGTVVTGRVTDKTTGKPIKGSILYATVSGNKHLADLPGKDVHGRGPITYDLDAAGRFRFVAPPGPGIILVQTASYTEEEKPYPRARIRAEDRNKPYLRGGDGLGEYFITSESILHSLSGSHAYRVLDPAVGTEKLTADLQLEPGNALAGKVVGPDGKPFVGATITGLSATYERPTTLKADTFTAQALLADDTRTVAALHRRKKLAGTVVVQGKDKGPAVVRLAAWGAVTGRVVDGEGKPIRGALVRLNFTVQGAADLHYHLVKGQPVTTDAAGRFRWDVPFAGVPFVLSFAHKGRFLSTDRELRELTVEAGKTRALGDIRVKAAE
jgi:RNA polymerase sigma factor (sigma-70 family)